MKIEDGYDFDGSRIRRATFDLTSPDCDKELEDFLVTLFPVDKEEKGE